MAMVEEVRRQFRTIPGIMEGTGKPEYDKCVAISTEASIKKMVLPGAIAIVAPLIIGFMPGLGAEALGGFLAGATVSGVLMGMFQNNAGGAWDNAKKSFEKGVEINGEIFPHKASVTGDTVGDPFKDTSGPSMNILIKLMSIVSLVIAPTLAQIAGTGHGHEPTEAEQVKEAINAIKAFGLIKDGESYDMDYEDGVLEINGQVIPQATLDSITFNKNLQFEAEFEFGNETESEEAEEDSADSTKVLKEVKEEIKIIKEEKEE
ncbi:MAG: sodium/proton-translocating pyrophosphatase, partial [Chitinophagaceae bacterium]|nr:sodium/proton-translocating pyrophosphatase [Chitinophagaceae bacterium]